MSQKIVRKYLIYHLPDKIDAVKGETYNQVYLIKDKDNDLRLRKKGKKHSLILKKSKNDTVFSDITTAISPEQFADLWPAAEGRQIKKIRRIVSHDSIKLKIDVYEGKLKGLIMAYAEFDCRTRASDFNKPVYLQEEVTYDKRFKGSNLSLISRSDLKKILPINKPGHYKLIGVLPYRMNQGRAEIIMVTTRSKGSWILPKGQPMSCKSNDEVAQLEALEEAGIRGKIIKTPLLIPFNRNRENISMQLYPMEVTHMDELWEESAERKRKILTINEARALTKQEGIKSAMGFFNLLTGTH